MGLYTSLDIAAGEFEGLTSNFELPRKTRKRYPTIDARLRLASAGPRK